LGTQARVAKKKRRTCGVNKKKEVNFRDKLFAPNDEPRKPPVPVYWFPALKKEFQKGFKPKKKMGISRTLLERGPLSNAKEAFLGFPNLSLKNRKSENDPLSWSSYQTESKSFHKKFLCNSF
jgi:hypothetical protein